MNLYNYTVIQDDEENYPEREIFVDIYAETEQAAKKIAINTFYFVVCLNHSIKFEKQIEPLDTIVILNSYPY